MGASPYAGLRAPQWTKRTAELLKKYPLRMSEICEIVNQSWASLFKSKLGTKGFRIGQDIFPRPQIMGFLLEELIVLELASRFPRTWQRGREKNDKDVVCLKDAALSFEIKTSTHATQIFGNRSYGQKQRKRRGRTSTAKTKPIKEKSGYYLAVNFEGFGTKETLPRVRRIRFGWLDHKDWVAQKSETGQQARVELKAQRSKLRTLFEAE